jgi:hypothetical protein
MDPVLSVMGRERANELGERVQECAHGRTYERRPPAAPGASSLDFGPPLRAHRGGFAPIVALLDRSADGADFVNQLGPYLVQPSEEERPVLLNLRIVSIDDPS